MSMTLNTELVYALEIEKNDRIALLVQGVVVDDENDLATVVLQGPQGTALTLTLRLDEDLVLRGRWKEEG